MPTPDPAPPAAPAPCINPPAAGTATDPWSFVTPAQWVSDYLARVTNFSVWTDWVGFDLYPVPDGEVSRIITDPYRGGLEVQSYNHTVYNYMQWLNVNIAKPRFLASQGFSMARNTEVLLDWCLSASAQRAPTWQELSNMNYQAYERGAFLVLYWGIHLLQPADVQPGGLYDSLLYVSSVWGT
jgi:hypothetical protein